MSLNNKLKTSLQTDKTPYQRVSWYDIKQSDGKAFLMLEFWEVQSIPSLPLLPVSFWPGAEAPDRVLSMG